MRNGKTRNQPKENIKLVNIIRSVQSDHFFVKMKSCSTKESSRRSSHLKFN